MDLSPFILKAQCECLNENDEHPLTNALSTGGGFLQSDCDEQLIISITFNQAVKVHSLKVKGPMDKGPKTIKIFINQPRTLDFDMAESCSCVQELELSPGDLEGNPVNLRYVKFQNVNNIQLFIKDNISGNDVTQIDHVAIIGTPISTTNMGDFKRVAGKKGESH
ncbi:PITH domain [Popillia japonica]|uniref:PITH domain n=1 Tax=Popillia japonica TaxID=7064 RepID=A0AAW1LLC0_POPJA